jgi:hypothetical protein
MGKTKLIWLPLVAVALIIGWLAPSNSSNSSTSTAPSSSMKTPTTTKTATPTPTPATPLPKPAVLDYWPSGLKIVDITDTSSRNCTFDMCVILKVTALKTCSKITLDGTVYTSDDEEVDSFSDDFAKLAKGKSRTLEFGTDAASDLEDYVELDDSTCWK